MIKGFAARETEEFFRGCSSRQIPADVQARALRKLLVLNAATSLDDIGRIPGNRLEKLKGDRAGQHSIRVNDQWRVCFVWRDGDAYAVEIADYHR